MLDGSHSLLQGKSLGLVLFLGKKQKAASRYGSLGSPPAPREEWASRVPNLKHTFVSPGGQAAVASAWDVKSLLACKKSKSLGSARERRIPRCQGEEKGMTSPFFLFQSALYSVTLDHPRKQEALRG